MKTIKVNKILKKYNQTKKLNNNLLLTNKAKIKFKLIPKTLRIELNHLLQLKMNLKPIQLSLIKTLRTISKIPCSSLNKCKVNNNSNHHKNNSNHNLKKITNPTKKKRLKVKKIKLKKEK